MASGFARRQFGARVFGARGMHRWGALVAAGCLLMAACTSQTSDDDSAGSDSGSDTGATSAAGADAPGVTDDTIKVSLIAADLAALSEQNLAPEIGNAQKTLEAVVADINANGGVAGRQIELVPHVIAGAQAVLNPDLGRQACVQATEDDKPFAVIVAAAIPAQTVECVAVDHDNALAITMDSWPDSDYEGADGRLFSVATHTSLGREREYRAWPKILDERGALAGKKIGIVRMDTTDQEESVDRALKPSLEDLGYEVAAESVLPCPEGSQATGCEQHDVAIQRLQDAGVDFVFLVAQTLAGSATVEAAANVGFEPEWTTTGNNVTDTVAKFFTNAKDNYDGAWGINKVFTDATDDTNECNRIAVAGGAEEFPPQSDGYGFTAVTCLQLQTLVRAIEAVQGPITQPAVIEALENLDDLPLASGPPGSLGPDKHDAGDYVFLSRYSASSETFEPTDAQEPIKVD
jgi:ABC-type branched-subunit amino acid transport system substrate-binding protein